MSIGAIERSGSNEHDPFDWTIDGDLFTMSLLADGFTQYRRRAPVSVPCQRLSVGGRGGLSFDQRRYASSNASRSARPVASTVLALLSGSAGPRIHRATGRSTAATVPSDH